MKINPAFKIAIVSILASCGSTQDDDLEGHARLFLFQFEGQHVLVEACGKVILNHRVTTDLGGDSSGLSEQHEFAKEGKCELRVKVDDEFEDVTLLSNSTRYVTMTYRGNKNFVDGVDECGVPCLGYSIEQFSTPPLLD